MRYYFLFFLLSVCFFSCDKKTKNDIDVSNISVNFEIERFDVDFYNSSEENLPSLKSKYPILFPKETPDSIWISKIHSKDEQELFAEVQKKYKDFDIQQEELSDLFKHVKFYDKSFKSPKVYTVLSNLDYDYRTIYLDSLLIISLDLYLGSNHPFYNDYPGYIKNNNSSKRIIVDLANNIIEEQMIPSNDRSFIGKMISEGKKMYLLDLYLPKVNDAIKIGYSDEKFQWAVNNEEQVWKYFIDKKLLYSTDTKLNQRFLNEAPFSKFYLVEDSKSPGRIGRWIGWQIVRSFMNKNDVSLQTLLTTSSEEIFKKSNYKPRK